MRVAAAFTPVFGEVRNALFLPRYLARFVLLLFLPRYLARFVLYPAVFTAVFGEVRVAATKSSYDVHVVSY